MIKNLFYTLAFLIILSSCGKHKPTDNFERADFGKTVSLKGEIIPFNTAKNPLSYTILKDSLIFVVNYGDDEHFVEIYSLKSKKLINLFAKKGKGPNELLSCNLLYRNPNDNFLILHDVVKQSAYIYDIDSVVKKGDNYSPKITNLPRYAKDVAVLDDKTLLGFNNYSLKSDRFSNDVAPLFKVAIEEKSVSKIDSSKAKFFTANVTGAYILPSPSTDQVWLADFYVDRIDVYNKDLKFLKSLKGPDGIKPKYYERKMGSVSFGSEYYRAYYPCAFTDKAVYLVYLGHNGLPENESFEKKVEVFKLNWSGELLQHYQLDQFIYNVSISKDEKYLYGTATDKYGKYPKLVRYEL